MRHKQLAQGGVFKLPVHDNQGRVLKDKETGDVVFEDVVVLPNRQALETRLRWKAPDRFPGQNGPPPAEPQALPGASDYAKPSQLDDMLADVFARLQARGIEFKPAFLACIVLVLVLRKFRTPAPKPAPCPSVECCAMAPSRVVERLPHRFLSTRSVTVLSTRSVTARNFGNVVA
jgi:hypothetical protein